MSEEKALEIIRDFDVRAGNRGVWESFWDDIAELVYPNMREKFRTGDFTTPGDTKTDRQMDSAPTVALVRFSAIMDSLLTPRNQTWHRLIATDPDLMKQHSVQLYFEEVTRLLFQHRYAPEAAFSTNNQLVYMGLGAFGTAGLFIDGLAGSRGLRYKSVHVGDLFPKENHQGQVNNVIRRAKFTARQLVRRKKWIDQLPEPVLEAASDPKRAEAEFMVLHRIMPRADFDDEAIDERGLKFESTYVLKEHPVVLEEGGFHSWPLPTTRYEQAPGEVFGRSPAMQALPAIKSLMVQKRVLLEQGHRSVNPVLLTHDDGSIQNVRLRPGSVVPGSMNQDGRPLVGALPTGDHVIGKDLMEDEKQAISAAFLTELFQILVETPRMTATEVLERAQEKSILLAPTVGRQQSDYLGPTIEREIDLLERQGVLPPMPEELREAQGEFEIQYDSPLSRLARAEEVGGFNDTINVLTPILNTGSEEALAMLDNFDFDQITRGIAQLRAVPASWMKSFDRVEELREQRAEQQAAALQAQTAPETLKAVAQAKKAGVTEKDLE
jgi:hypothetical protein